MKIACMLFGILLSLSTFGMAAIKEQNVDYSANGVTMKGYIAYDDAKQGKRPGILVVHEWWGSNEYVRKRARMLAELGYTAMAVDMYGDGKQAAHPDDAGKFAGEVMANMETAKARFLAAMDILKAQKTVDPTKIAAIGYCFGGGVVLEMARQGVDLKGVASFHGSLGTKTLAKPGQVKAVVLVCHGADDSFNPQAAVDAFKKEMTDAKVNYTLLVYPGAKHGFTNPEADENAKKFNLPIGYNAAADKKSWADLQAFLTKIFA